MNYFGTRELFGSDGVKLDGRGYVIDMVNRLWTRCSAGHMFFDRSKTLSPETTILFKDLPDLPQCVKDTYKGVIVPKDAVSIDRYNYLLEPKENLSKYYITNRDALTLARYIAKKMPRNINELKKSTVERFVKILDDENGYDISAFIFFPVKMEIRLGSWSRYCSVEKYIVTDTKLNPVDVKKFFETMDEIIVE